MEHVAGRKYWSLTPDVGTVHCDLWYAAQLVDVTCKLPTRPFSVSLVWLISGPWWI